MKKLLNILIIIVGLASFVWGARLVHYNYVLQRDVTYSYKSGSEVVTPEIKKSHSTQATKDLVVHLGLIVLGVCLVVVPIASYRKAHNKSLKNGSREELRAP